MNTEAFTVWTSLFDDEIKTTWTAECKELKCAAMVLCALKKELKKIEIKFDAQLNGYKEKIFKQQNQQLSEKPIDIKEASKISEFDQPNMDLEFSDIFSKTVLLPESPKINKSRTIISNKRKKAAQLTPSLLKFPNTSEDDTTNASLNLLHVHTPQNVDKNVSDFLDSSIVETTPNIRIKQRRKKKKVVPKNSTLTQMFPHNYTSETDKTDKENSDYVKQQTEIDDGGSLYLEQILDYINQDKVLDVNVGCQQSNKTHLASNLDRAKSPDFIYETKTVRGKARKNLPGWSCKECKAFYENLSLSPQKLKAKMDECSKHRNKFPPADDTPPGVWDLKLPPTPMTFIE